MNQTNVKMGRYVHSKFEPIKYYLLAFINYSSFEGRSRRKEFWYFVGINSILILLMLALRLALLNQQPTYIIDLLLGLFCLSTLIPFIAVSVRRMNDIGRSPWLLLINLLPVLGNFIFLIFMLTDSQMGYNKHGEYPKFAPIHF